MQTSPPGSACTAGELFAFLWDTLAEVLGVSATATLVRRSAKRLSGQGVDLSGLTVTRNGFEHSYIVAESWQLHDAETLRAFRALAREVRSLLVELTGAIVAQRLDSHPQLRDSAVFTSPEEP